MNEDAKAKNLTVVISRRWDNPTINVYLEKEEIKLEMSLDDYIKAILTEIGSPALVLTTAQLAAKMKTARAVVELEMKHASTFAV